MTFLSFAKIRTGGIHGDIGDFSPIIFVIFSSTYFFFHFIATFFYMNRYRVAAQNKHMQKKIARNKENKYIDTYYGPFSFTFGSYLYRYINPITAINRGANYAHHMGVFLFDLKMSM